MVEVVCSYGWSWLYRGERGESAYFFSNWPSGVIMKARRPSLWYVKAIYLGYIPSYVGAGKFCRKSMSNENMQVGGLAPHQGGRGKSATGCVKSATGCGKSAKVDIKSEYCTKY